MKCVLVLLAVALCFCIFHTCAKEADIQTGSFPKLNMRFNNLQQALPASTAERVTVEVKGTAAGDSAGASAVTVTVTVKGTGAGDAVTFTGTGSGTLTGDGTTPIEVTISSTTGTTVSGTVNVQGPVAAGDTFTGTATLTDTDPVDVTISGSTDKTVTGTIKVTGAKAGTTVTVSGNLVIARKANVDTTPQGGAGGGNKLPVSPNVAEGPAASAATITKAPETTTTSTAAPTDAPQQSTDKPTNPTEGKTDSSNSHVAFHVALFIGTTALFAVV